MAMMLTKSAILTSRAGKRAIPHNIWRIQLRPEKTCIHNKCVLSLVMTLIHWNLKGLLLIVLSHCHTVICMSQAEKMYMWNTHFVTYAQWSGALYTCTCMFLLKMWYLIKEKRWSQLQKKACINVNHAHIR